ALPICRREQHCFVVQIGHDGTCRLLGEPAGLEADGAGAERTIVDYGLGLVYTRFGCICHRFSSPRSPLRTLRPQVASFPPPVGGTPEPRCRSSIEAAGPTPDNHYRGPAWCSLVCGSQSLWICPLIQQGGASHLAPPSVRQRRSCRRWISERYRWTSTRIR